MLDYELYMKNFNKTFTNFCNKRPVKLEKVITPESVILKDKNTNKVKTFKFDYTRDIKDFIHEIQDWVYTELCPILTEVKKEEHEYSQKEIEQMIEDGKDIDEVLLMKKEKITEVNYRIERILLLTNYLFVRNLETNEQARYRLFMPVSSFLNNVRSKWSSKYSFTMFQKYSQFMNTIDPEFKKIK